MNQYENQAQKHTLKVPNGNKTVYDPKGPAIFLLLVELKQYQEKAQMLKDDQGISGMLDKLCKGFIKLNLEETLRSFQQIIFQSAKQ
ncbi:unnamed protein product [Paramecium pentaurelia]|uniref:Uncharacterized protein n=1 Tax=Paramecium pentaurelia TaxID=43138 RepID=A0A8S1V954_9CILI|nr:unnamed protein product [Paramecium pentaurelia]